MPGIGKTRMIEEIWKEAREKGIFDKAVYVGVGADLLDVIKIQNQIAMLLNLHFESQHDEEIRASQLENRFMNGGKLLILFDNVWSQIPLHRIGIPLSDGCKIIFTSRSKHVCLRNNCNHLVEINPLTPTESWDLFSNIIGTNKIDSMRDESLAMALCNQCVGLPLVIYVFGKALKSTPRNFWKDAHFKLENGLTERIPGINPEVYACIKFSFENLEEDAKACLLLCTLFPEDARIPVRNLIQLATGSQLVCNGRSRLLKMVDMLMSSSMLFKDVDDQHVKLNHIVRDVTRFIAFSYPEYAFSYQRCGSRLLSTDDFGTRKVLHLDLEENDFGFPDDLLCPDLHTLSLRSLSTLEPQYSQYYFQAWDLASVFVNLRFLVLTNILCKHEFSLRPLGKLKTLVLDRYNLFRTDVRFFPENLETLCIWDCNLPKKLELPDLKFLQKLEILGGTSEVVFVPNTIASLSSLEELHIPNGFKILDEEGRWLPILDELSTLTRLRSLQIYFSQFEDFQDRNIFSKLLDFNIRVGEPLYDEHNLGSSSRRLIELSGGNPFECFEGLIGRAENVTLQSTNVKTSSIWNSNIEAFTNLRELYIEDCEPMEYIAKISNDEIQPSFQRPESFLMLTILHITNCSAMKYLFCNSVAKCLVQLQQLSIYYCPVMEVVVMYEGTSDGDIVNFPKLESLELCTMPKLKSFYKVNEEMHSSSTSTMVKKTTTHFHLRSVILRDLPNLKNFMHGANYECHMPALVEVKVQECRLSNLFTLNVFKNLQQLEALRVLSCKLLEGIVEEVRDDKPFNTNEKIITFSLLSKIVLKDLPNLKSFMHGAKYECHMPALVEVKVQECGLSTLFTLNVFKSLQQLRELEVLKCRSLEDIVVEVRDDETFYTNEKITISQLSTVVLDTLPKLKSFSRTAKYAFDMPALYTIRLYGCPLVENFTSKETSTGLVSVYTDWQHGEEVSSLNEYISQNCKRGSHLSDTAGESSCSNKQLEEEAERDEEELPPEETVVSETRYLRVEIQIFINSQQEVTSTKTSVHHHTLLE